MASKFLSAPKLQFTKEERADPALEKAIRAADKAADRRDIAQSKLPTRKVPVRETVSDSVSGKVITQLRFEASAKKRPSRICHPIANAVGAEAHRQAEEYEEDNTGLQAVHTAEQTGESVLRMGENAHHAHRLRTYRTAEKAEEKLDNANVRALQAKAARDNLQSSSNPISRWQQKRAIKKEYAAAQNSYTSGTTAKTAADTAKRTSSAKKSRRAIKSRKGLLIGALGIMLVFIMNAVTSCVPIAQTTLSGIVASTYPAEETDILAAEAFYTGLEEELQYEMDNYARLHPEYDECRFNLDTIWHDPYSLISFLSALQDGQPWTIDDVTDDMVRIFERQYTLTESVRRQTKYRTEMRTGVREVLDEETGLVHEEVYEYEVSVPYTYTICTVTLDNFNLSHLPVLSMSKGKLGLYALYMSMLGNMPELFSDHPYASVLKDPFIYDIPDEYFADENFARLIEEGEKYLGFPYIWGGTSPDTSFDCCGFVSFVLTNSGVLNTGPRGVEGLYGLTDRIHPSEARPGDLVFFSETYDGGGLLSHVGIYAGDGMMLHCGNPIGYVDIGASFYSEHFYAFGRLPI